MNVYQDLFELDRIDWQGLSVHTTRKGKAKPILTGSPRKTFWNLWKRSKAELRAAGLDIRVAGIHESTSRKKGQQGRKVKQWEIVVWLNKGNRAVFDFKGLIPKTNNPF